MSKRRQEQWISELLSGTRCAPNDEISELDERIKLYVEKYQLNTDDLKEKLSTGAVKETQPVCELLMLLDLRERLLRSS